jgi:hypothetical protein
MAIRFGKLETFANWQIPPEKPPLTGSGDFHILPPRHA